MRTEHQIFINEMGSELTVKSVPVGEGHYLMLTCEWVGKEKGWPDSNYHWQTLRLFLTREQLADLSTMIGFALQDSIERDAEAIEDCLVRAGAKVEEAR